MQRDWPPASGAPFGALPQRQAAQPLPARPVVPYWRGVGRRLARNRRATVSAAIILALLLFTLAGPLVWQQDPARQMLGQVSLGPAASTTAEVVLQQQRWLQRAEPIPGTLADAPVAGLSVVEANTERVRLRWKPVAGAEGYRIYRHTRAPRNRQDLGLPLGETWRRGAISYEDRLQLRSRPYHYSVVAFAAGEETEAWAGVEAHPHPAIDFMRAQLQGLIPVNADATAWAGRQLQLPAHPLGTDYLGRDMLSRLMHGARTSLFIGIVAPLFFIAFGSLYGALAGFSGGLVDEWMMRLADFVVALPFLLFMILFRVMFGIGPGQSGVVPLVVAMVALGWPASARLVRGQILQLREESFVEAARLFGARRSYLILRHMLPNVLGVILVALSFAIPSAIFTEAFLSFIGMGVTPPTPSWGTMSYDGMKTLWSHPHELLFPSLFISVSVLAFNLFGDALRDALDARLEQP